MIRFGYPVFIALMVLSALGLLYGLYFYLRPDRIVHKRVKKEHLDLAQKDAEFRRWLDAEIETQVKKTRRMGLIMVVLEAIWIILIIGLWHQSQGI